ncbi:hypothetical protein F5888DRAFT_978096 [Russula emetica]|nr:hypothetical protein F5888DRAFT_978096 [Russula emetica]
MRDSVVPGHLHSPFTFAATPQVSCPTYTCADKFKAPRLLSAFNSQLPLNYVLSIGEKVSAVRVGLCHSMYPLPSVLRCQDPVINDAAKHGSAVTVALHLMRLLSMPRLWTLDLVVFGVAPSYITTGARCCWLRQYSDQTGDHNFCYGRSHFHIISYSHTIVEGCLELGSLNPRILPIQDRPALTVIVQLELDMPIIRHALRTLGPIPYPRI